MPARKRATDPHVYSVFVDAYKEDGTPETVKLYIGNSLYAAQLALARGITDYPRAWRIDLRRDFVLWRRIHIE